MQDNQVSSYLTQLIIRKLTDSKPFYQTRSILHDTDKLLCYMTNISQNARRSTSQTNLGASQRGLDWTSRPITSPNTTRASESFKWNGRYSSARRFRPWSETFFWYFTVVVPIIYKSWIQTVRSSNHITMILMTLKSSRALLGRRKNFSNVFIDYRIESKHWTLGLKKCPNLMPKSPSRKASQFQNPKSLKSR